MTNGQTNERIEIAKGVLTTLNGHQGYLSYIIESSKDKAGCCYLFQYAPNKYVSPTLDTEVGFLYWPRSGHCRYILYKDDWREVYSKTNS